MNSLNLQEISKGQFKGMDADLYYKDWMSSIEKHKYFEKWLETKKLVDLSLADLHRLNTDINLYAFDPASYCNSYTDQLDFSNTNPLEKYLVNQCIFDKIDELISSDVPEYQEYKQNFNESFGFSMYIRLKYLIEVSDIILEKKTNSTITK
jgi:hypothetical protein